MSQASLATTFGSILGTVTTTANALTGIVDSGASVIDVMNASASAWRAEALSDAEARIKAAPIVGREKAAVRLANHRKEILSLCRDSEFAELYAKSLQELSVEEVKGE